MSNLIIKNKLPSVKDVKDKYPLTKKMEEQKANNDLEIQNIILGKSNKLLLLIGPCSSDNEEALMEYLSFLRNLQEKVKDRIFIIPRIYTTKPRTNGEGYKGILHRPNIKESSNIVEGLFATRRLHYRALSEFGFSSSDEMLYVDNYKYLDDLLSYVVVGARSVEDQLHRFVASGLDIPVGLKNPTSGDLNVLINSLIASTSGHTFSYENYEVVTSGNKLSHGILRGYSNVEGELKPNYQLDNLVKINELLKLNNLNQSIIVDCSHANSNKDYLKQIEVALSVVSSINQSDDIKKLVKGLMIESYLLDGSQNELESSILGKSYTDSCLGKEKTEELVLKIYELLK